MIVTVTEIVLSAVLSCLSSSTSSFAGKSAKGRVFAGLLEPATGQQEQSYQHRSLILREEQSTLKKELLKL